MYIATGTLLLSVAGGKIFGVHFHQTIYVFPIEIGKLFLLRFKKLLRGWKEITFEETFST